MPDSPHSPPAIRHDGWTPELQHRFLERLSESGNVTEAAASVGKSRASAYALRQRPDGADFARAWAMALRKSVDVLADLAFERAAQGEDIPVFYKGEQIGTRRRHDNRLLMFLLRTRDPVHYGRTAEIAGLADQMAARKVDGWYAKAMAAILPPRRTPD